MIVDSRKPLCASCHSRMKPSPQLSMTMTCVPRVGFVASVGFYCNTSVLLSLGWVVSFPTEHLFFRKTSHNSFHFNSNQFRLRFGLFSFFHNRLLLLLQTICSVAWWIAALPFFFSSWVPCRLWRVVTTDGIVVLLSWHGRCLVEAVCSAITTAITIKMKRVLPSQSGTLLFALTRL